MDESKVKKLITIVNTMSKKGIPLNEIRNNLKETGLKDNQIDIILAKADIKPTSSELHEAVVSIDKKISSGDHVKNLTKELEKNTKDTESVMQNVGDMQQELLMHRKKLDEIHKLVTGNGKTVSGGAHPQLEQKIDNLTDLITDLKPALKSIESSTKKLVELNRKVLMKL